MTFYDVLRCFYDRAEYPAPHAVQAKQKSWERATARNQLFWAFRTTCALRKQEHVAERSPRLKYTAEPTGTFGVAKVSEWVTYLPTG